MIRSGPQLEFWPSQLDFFFSEGNPGVTGIGLVLENRSKPPPPTWFFVSKIFYGFLNIPY
jgi:hypothetical protein